MEVDKDRNSGRKSMWKQIASKLSPRQARDIAQDRSGIAILRCQSMSAEETDETGPEDQPGVRPPAFSTLMCYRPLSVITG